MTDRGVERADAVLTYDGQSRAAGERLKTIEVCARGGKGLSGAVSGVPGGLSQAVQRIAIPARIKLEALFAKPSARWLGMGRAPEGAIS